MASISISQDSFLRRIGGGSGVGARSDQKPTGGVAGKRLPVDEYIASLPAQAAIIGGKTLETLTSLPPVPQPKGQAGGINNAGGVGIGINIGRTGFNAIGGNVIGIGVNNANGIGAGINTIGGTGASTNNAGGLGGVDTVDTTGAINAIGIGTINTVNPNDDDNADEVDTEEVDETDEADKTANEAEAGNIGNDNAGAELTPEEQSVVNELRNRDREVRAHEQAHVSAGGAYIRGGASYQYQRGPDNKSYAVGGEVGIDTAPERDDPGATITKMQAVRAAALAPSDPSAQDRAVAAAAARNESAARADLAEKERPVEEERDADA